MFQELANKIKKINSSDNNNTNNLVYEIFKVVVMTNLWIFKDIWNSSDIHMLTRHKFT